MSRVTRRCDLSDFRDVAASAGLLVHVARPDVALPPLQRAAVAHWRARVAVKHPKCISCSSGLAGAKVGLFVLAVPDVAAPTLCSVSAVCSRCADRLSPAELDQVCARVLRKLAPRGEFLDPREDIA